MMLTVAEVVEQFGLGSLDVCPHCHESFLFKAPDYFYGHPLSAVHCMCGFVDYRADEPVIREVPASLHWNSEETRLSHLQTARYGGKRSQQKKAKWGNKTADALRESCDQLKAAIHERGAA